MMPRSKLVRLRSTVTQQIEDDPSPCVFQCELIADTGQSAPLRQRPS